MNTGTAFGAVAGPGQGGTAVSGPLDERLPDVIRSALAELVTGHPTIMRLAVTQRAKFEGWLKLELAGKLTELGLSNVQFETPYQGGRADLSFGPDDRRALVELKTCNTNYRMPGCKPLTRPITKNVQDICADCRNLQSAPDGGIMAFVMFPVPLHGQARGKAESRLQRQLDRIRLAAGLVRPPADEFVPVTEHAGLLVYAFAVQPDGGAASDQGGI